jgi:nucleoside-diphosphate-sugar epimerase
MNIVLTGGCGYVGTLLTPALLAEGHAVTVVDTQWFGNYLAPHPRLTVIKADVRQTADIPLEGIDAIVHLANIANDPSVELDPVLSWEVNVLATMQLADAAARRGIGQFIFASSGSVYGVKDEPQVTEDLTLVPISVYNKTKMIAERVVLSYADRMRVHCLRPATVCGFSPRMRLDLSVNMLTMQAHTAKRITVFGGKQVRPNIHVDDLVAAYLHLLKADVPSGCYNAGFENLSLLEIAEKVASQVPSEIVITGSNDPRSYRLNSDKLLATGFRPTRTVGDAIKEVADAFAEGRLRDDPSWHNLKWMKHVLEGGSPGPRS